MKSKTLRQVVLTGYALYSLSNQSPDRNINSCQLSKSVRQALRSWYRFLDIMSFMLDPFSLSWLSMLFSHVVLGLPCGIVPFTL